MRVSNCYSFYITTNSGRNVIYCGVTNNLEQRIVEHYLNRGSQKTFAGKYYCYWLLYFEDYQYIGQAIAREKEVKKWNREKKERLVREFNPHWNFLNCELYKSWPPGELFHRRDL